jgi:hypothetical protein
VSKIVRVPDLSGCEKPTADNYFKIGVDSTNL